MGQFRKVERDEYASQVDLVVAWCLPDKFSDYYKFVWVLQLVHHLGTTTFICSYKNILDSSYKLVTHFSDFPLWENRIAYRKIPSANARYKLKNLLFVHKDQKSPS